MKRFFLTEKLGKDFGMKGSEHNHLANVLRVKTGESVILCNGDEFDYEYIAEQITKTATQMRFVKQSLNTRNLKNKIHMYLPILKPDLQALMVQKLSEVGVHGVTFVKTTNSNPSNVNFERLQEIANQSCKQCGRSAPLCMTKSIVPFKKWCEDITCFDQVIIADECESKNSLANIKLTPEIAILIGPEGGFTNDERAEFQKIEKVISVSLGNRILRAETAAIVSAGTVAMRLEAEF